MLEGDRLWLRSLEPDDVEVLYRWENDPEVWKISLSITPISKQMLSEYVNSVHDLYLQRQLRLMICKKEDKLPVGTIDMFEFDPFHQRAGVGILISEGQHRRQGYATETLKILSGYAFKILGLRGLFAHIAASNRASVKLFEKAGYRKTGTLKDWIRMGADVWEDAYKMQLMGPDWMNEQQR